MPVYKGLLRLRWPILQVGCSPPVSQNAPLPGIILQHKGPSTVFFKSSVLVYATPRSRKYEKDPVARAFEIMGWPKAKFQVLEWCGMLSKASIPFRCGVLTRENIGGEILNNDESIIHKDRR